MERVLVQVPQNITIFSFWEEFFREDACDLIEVRLDLMEVDLREVFLEKFPLFSFKQKVWLTDREEISLEERKARLYRYAGTGAGGIDIDYGFPQDFLYTLKAEHPSLGIIRSYHGKTPLSLKELSCFDNRDFLFKVAFTVENFTSLLSFLKEWEQSYPHWVFSPMGKSVSWARIWLGLKGTPWQFFYLDTKPLAEGQVSLELWNAFFKNREQNIENFYGLLGYPLDKSKGIYFHNTYFLENKKKSAYLNLPHEDFSFSSNLKDLKDLGFKGFSITTPFKERVTEALEEKPHFTAFNTLVYQSYRWKAENTDLKAVLLLLKEHHFLPEKDKIAILGGGAVAKVLFLEMQKQGWECFCLLRNRKRFREEDFPFLYPLETSLSDFRVIVNTIPEPFIPNIESVKEGAIWIDFERREKPLSFSSGVVYIAGEEVFLKQAFLQQEFWLNNSKKSVKE